MQHLWTTLPAHDPHNATMDVFGLVLGLGFILSFGYWCTDFVLIQRAFAARQDRRTPSELRCSQDSLSSSSLSRHRPRPGRASPSTTKETSPATIRPSHSSCATTTASALLGLGIAAILASLISGLAGNINALSAVWTHDLYRTHLRPRQTDRHYLRAARIATAAACLLSILTAYIALRYSNLMDYLQLIFSLFNAPLFAVFLLGMFTRWATPAGGFCGLLCGVLTGATYNLALHHGAIAYGSQMLANFYGAIYAFSACLSSSRAVSLFTQKKSAAELHGVTYFTQDQATHRISTQSYVLAAILLADLHRSKPNLPLNPRIRLNHLLRTGPVELRTTSEVFTLNSCPSA